MTPELKSRMKREMKMQVPDCAPCLIPTLSQRSGAVDVSQDKHVQATVPALLKVGRVVQVASHLPASAPRSPPRVVARGGCGGRWLQKETFSLLLRSSAVHSKCSRSRPRIGSGRGCGEVPMVVRGASDHRDHQFHCDCNGRGGSTYFMGWYPLPSRPLVEES
jgi:hypothetical protein